MIRGNTVTDNGHGGDFPFPGNGIGVQNLQNAKPVTRVLVSHNQVHGNAILHNQPDLFWDGTGTGNAFQGNRCESSVPDGLCH